MLVVPGILIATHVQGQSFSKLPGSMTPGRKDTIIQFRDTDQETYMPLTIIKGKSQGPVFTIIAGIHGYEYPPIVAVQELLNDISIDKLKGTLIIIPIANVAAFYQRTPFLNPLDKKNLNNAFPGSASGTITEQLAYWITQNIIPSSEVLLDIHGGDANEDLLPFICYYDRKDATIQTVKARQLSKASGMGIIVSYPYTISPSEPAKYAFKQAVQDGITAVSIEAGKLGNVQAENVSMIKEAVYRMISFMNMYPLEQTRFTGKPMFFTQQAYIKVPESGLFKSPFKAGDQVTKNEVVGTITDEFGKTVATILAPENGIILYKTGTPPVNKGETLFCIGY